jgi:hypothetical protein
VLPTRVRFSCRLVKPRHVEIIVLEKRNVRNHDVLCAGSSLHEIIQEHESYN